MFALPNLHERYSKLSPAEFRLTRVEGVYIATVRYKRRDGIPVPAVELLLGDGDMQGEFTPQMLQHWCAAVLEHLGLFDDLDAEWSERSAAALAGSPLMQAELAGDWSWDTHYLALGEREVRRWALGNVPG